MRRETEGGQGKRGHLLERRERSRPRDASHKRVTRRTPSHARVPASCSNCSPGGCQCHTAAEDGRCRCTLDPYPYPQAHPSSHRGMRSPIHYQPHCATALCNCRCKRIRLLYNTALHEQQASGISTVQPLRAVNALDTTVQHLSPALGLVPHSERSEVFLREGVRLCESTKGKHPLTL